MKYQDASPPTLFQNRGVVVLVPSRTIHILPWPSRRLRITPRSRRAIGPWGWCRTVRTIPSSRWCWRIHVTTAGCRRATVARRRGVVSPSGRGPSVRAAPAGCRRVISARCGSTGGTSGCGGVVGRVGGSAGACAVRVGICIPGRGF